MNKQANYFKPYLKKALVLLMAVVMVFTYMPSMAFAGVGEPEDNNTATTTETCPVTIKTPDGTALTATATEETIAGDGTYTLGSATVYEVQVTAEATEVTISGYDKDDDSEADNFLAYNYDEDGNWLAGYYSDGGGYWC